MNGLVCVLITTLPVITYSWPLAQTDSITWHTNNELALDEEKEDYTEVNRNIAKYLIGFSNFQKESKDKNVMEVMDIIKLLIVKSWIKMLHPERDLVKSFVPLNDMQNLEAVRNNIVRPLRMSNAEYPVADAIITFSESIEPQLYNLIAKEAEDLKETLDQKLLELNGDVDDRKKEELLNEYRLKDEELDQTEFDLEFLGIARQMYLQSYVTDFLLKIPEDILVILSSNGHMKVFPVPGFDVESLAFSQ